MVCGNAAIEVALSATRCATTRFQMQTAINAERPLPFPTPAKRICILGAYDSSVFRGYLNPHWYKMLAKQKRVSDTAVRKWFTEKRMRQGHQSNYKKYPTQKRGKPPAVEVRTQLPFQRGRQPLAAQTLEGPSAGRTPKRKGEYVEEETPQEGKISVMWTDGLEQLTMYAFNPEAQEITTAPQEDNHHILSDPGAESQDSGLGYAELEIKEHPIEGPATPPGEPRKKINPRDPRRRPVTLAPPSTLYGKENLPGPSSSNVAQPALSTSRATNFLMPSLGPSPML